MGYIKPKDVHSPKNSWHLFEVLIDGGEGGPSYALGAWERDRTIGYRWNGSGDKPIGNPQSRGLPTWIILDEKLYEAVVDLLPADKRAIAKTYLGLK